MTFLELFIVKDLKSVYFIYSLKWLSFISFKIHINHWNNQEDKSYLCICFNFRNCCIKKFNSSTNSFIFLFNVKVSQLDVSFENIELNIWLKFSQANNALIDGFFWTFLKMVASIHQAFIVNAMPNPKHMSDFMRDYSPRTIFDQIVIDFIRLFPKKSLVISCKWKYTCPLSNTC